MKQKILTKDLKIHVPIYPVGHRTSLVLNQLLLLILLWLSLMMALIERYPKAWHMLIERYFMLYYIK